MDACSNRRKKPSIDQKRLREREREQADWKGQQDKVEKPRRLRGGKVLLFLLFLGILGLSTVANFDGILLTKYMSKSDEACLTAIKAANPYSRRHHAMIIPYRNREEFLARFIEYMGPYLKRNFPQDDFSLFIMDQADDELFNRGFLLNAGLTEIYQRMPATSCVINHDVDLVPKHDGVPYTNCTKPVQLASEHQYFHWSIPYPQYCGGVTNMHMVDWQTINGMSNDYVGWGGEDDDLYFRLLRNDLLRNTKRKNESIPEPIRPPVGKGVFVHLKAAPKNTTTTTVPKKEKPKNMSKALWMNPKHKDNLRLLSKMKYKEKDRWRHDGLSDIDFNVVKDEIIRDDWKGADGFFEIHHIRVLAQVNYSQAEGNKPT